MTRVPQDDQRDDAGAAELVALFDHEAGGAGRDHHVAQGVDGAQALRVNEQQAVAVSDQLDFALFRLGGVHMLAETEVAQDRRRLVLVQHGLVVFPDVQMVLAHAQQHGHILLTDDVALAEDGALFLVLDDLGDVMAQHVPDGFFGFYQLHGLASCQMISVSQSRLILFCISIAA